MSNLSWILNKLYALFGDSLAQRVTLEISDSLPNRSIAVCQHRGNKHHIKMSSGKSLGEYTAMAAHEFAHAVLHDMLDVRVLEKKDEELAVQAIAHYAMMYARSNCPSQEAGTLDEASKFAHDILVNRYMKDLGGTERAVSRFAVIRSAFRVMPRFLSEALANIERNPHQYAERTRQFTVISGGSSY